MKFTPQNFRTEFPKLQNTDKELQKRFELMCKTKPADYKNSEVIKRGIDLFVMALNQRYGGKIPSSLPSKKSQKVPKKPKEKSQKTKKEKPPKAPKTPKIDNSERVEKILPEVVFIRRFAALDGKMVKTSRDTALRILNSLQKAIVEKVIRKTSPYADEIMNIQDNLIKIIDSKYGDIVIAIPEKYKEIAKSQKLSDDIKVIKQFIAIQGKTDVKTKAKALLQKVIAIQKQSNSVVVIKMALMNYIDGKTDTPEIDTRTLQGFYGLAGIEFDTPKTGTSVQSTQFLGATFDTLNFTGKWANFIGKPNRNFKIMVYGKAGSGKSTFALKFAHYLASNIGLRVLYVAGEEKLGYTLHEKIVRLNITSPNLYINDILPKDLSKYDAVFIDSVNTLNLEPSNLERLPKSKAYAYIFQCTKDGNYRGSQEFEHNADSVIEVKDMTATMHKNRFGGREKEVRI